jgi:hypothetical protein
MALIIFGTHLQTRDKRDTQITATISSQNNILASDGKGYLTGIRYQPKGYVLITILWLITKVLDKATYDR